MKTLLKAQRLQNVRYEVRGKLAEEADKLEAEGEKILKLNIGNPASFGFSAPNEVLDYMKSRIDFSQGYSEAYGIRAAREAILNYSSGKGISGIELNDIYTGNGASELIQISLDALLNSGDEILIPSPDYPLWTAAATMAGGKVVHYICDEQLDWFPDLKDIEDKITARTKAIVIINPNNPTGAIYPRSILEGIVNIARKHNLIIFSDEIYDRLLLDEDEHISIASLAPDLLCITLNGLSKSHMLCGFRIGWMVISGAKKEASDYIAGIDMITDMRLCSNVPGQAVIPAALSGKFRAEEYFTPDGRVNAQRETVYTMLNSIPGVSAVKPKAAFYIFPKLDKKKFNISDDNRFALDLLREKKIFIVPGSGFNWHEPDHFRIVYLPDPETLADGMNRLADFLDGYRQ
ncbi:MAG: pyridoxal phosphate-dependent aminotransferase [Eubacteriales bacterium]|nr:pyridoxal phosphate-dependent aminotransferase [Eubacteriales bacterium]